MDFGKLLSRASAIVARIEPRYAWVACAFAGRDSFQRANMSSAEPLVTQDLYRVLFPGPLHTVRDGTKVGTSHHLRDIHSDSPRIPIVAVRTEMEVSGKGLKVDGRFFPVIQLRCELAAGFEYFFVFFRIHIARVWLEFVFAGRPESAGGIKAGPD